MAKRKKKKTSEYIQRVDLPDVTKWASTGCTVLDLAISNSIPGGVPCGRITHVFGAESTAKTVVVTEPLGSAQRQGGLVWFVDAEGTFDRHRAKDLFGLDSEQDSFHYAVPESIEHLFDGVIKDAIAKIKAKGYTDKPNLIAVDSLTVLKSAREPDDLESASFGTERAKTFSRAFREFLREAHPVNLGLVAIDQTRTDVTKTFGDSDTTPGGKAVKFYSSVRIKLSHKRSIENEQEKDIGVEIGFKMVKNKVGPPFRTGQFQLLFDVGVDDVATNLAWLKENDPDQPEGGWFQFEDKKVNGFDNAIAHVEEKDLELSLQERVAKVWKEVYAPPKRKQKVRREGT